MNQLLQKLTGGDRRSVGRVDEVVNEVRAAPAQFGLLIDGMTADDPLIRMRSADAVEKLTVDRPEWLQPYKAHLLQEAAQVEQQEVRWHMAQLFSRLELNPSEQEIAYKILQQYLTDKSKIVKTFAMQALCDLAEKADSLRPPIIAQIEQLTTTGSPAMKSRGKKLLARLANLL